MYPFASYGLDIEYVLCTCIDHGKTEDHLDMVVEAGVLMIILLFTFISLISESPADTGVANDDDGDIEENVGEETIANLTSTVHNVTTLINLIEIA